MSIMKNTLKKQNKKWRKTNHPFTHLIHSSVLFIYFCSESLLVLVVTNMAPSKYIIFFGFGQTFAITKWLKNRKQLRQRLNLISGTQFCLIEKNNTWKRSATIYQRQMIEAFLKSVCLFFSVTFEEQIILICRSKPLETIKCYFTPETLYRQCHGKLIASSTLNND